MGNRMARDERPSRQFPSRKGTSSVFDAAAMIIHGNVPTPATVPTCLDELADWTEDAAAILNHLDSKSLQVLPENMEAPVRFLAFISQEQVDTKVTQDMNRFVNQKDVISFPTSCRFERASFYIQYVVVCFQVAHVCQEKLENTMDAGGVTFMLSGLEFSAYYRLLRRLAQLSELEEPKSLMADNDVTVSSDEESVSVHECAICMSHPQETVLPCLHGVCTSCEQMWVEKHMDCPFCRKKYTNRRRRKREQWEIQSWQGDDVREDMASLQAKLQLFWQKPIVDGSTNLHGYTRIGSSLKETIVDDDFVLLD